MFLNPPFFLPTWSHNVRYSLFFDGQEEFVDLFDLLFMRWHLWPLLRREWYLQIFTQSRSKWLCKYENDQQPSVKTCWSKYSPFQKGPNQLGRGWPPLPPPMVICSFNSWSLVIVLSGRHLDPWLRQIDFQGNFFSHENVRVSGNTWCENVRVSGKEASILDMSIVFTKK